MSILFPNYFPKLFSPYCAPPGNLLKLVGQKNYTMKKVIGPSIVLILLFPMISLPGEKQQKIKEEIKVTAVEIPVHVFHKGTPVKDLAQEDFEIYEGGRKQTVTGFEKIMRTIDSAEHKSISDHQKRVFILIFNVFDYNQAVEEGIDYFFQSIFKPGDQILIITENRTLNIEHDATPKNISLSLKTSLKNYKLISMQNSLQTFRTLDYEAERLLSILRGLDSGSSSPAQALMSYFDNYKRVWEDFSSKYIVPDIEQYRNILKRAKTTKSERWAICFQQREIFPRLKYGGRLEREIYDWTNSQSEAQGQVQARLVQRRQMELKLLMDVSENFPTQNLQSVFTELNIPFNLILLKSLRHMSSQDLEFLSVSQEFEDCLRKISSFTGGAFFSMTGTAEALEKISEQEDFYYLLVYSPDEKLREKERNIEVKVRRKGLNLVYPKLRAEEENPSIAISNFRYVNNIIEFALSYFERRVLKNRFIGLAEVSINIFDQNSESVFSETKTLELSKEEVHLSIDPGRLNKGTYSLIVSVTDKISNASDTLFTEVNVK
jgi:hypothetical protein